MFSLSHTTKTYPRLPYEALKNDVLGKSYGLSLVFVGRTRARELNKKHRKKSYVPNVLSFPIDQKNGEIYICPEVAKREASLHGMTYKNFTAYLYVHGLFHLKGFDHGEKMDRAEIKTLQKHGLA